MKKYIITLVSILTTIGLTGCTTGNGSPKVTDVLFTEPIESLTTTIPESITEEISSESEEESEGEIKQIGEITPEQTEAENSKTTISEDTNIEDDNMNINESDFATPIANITKRVLSDCSESKDSAMISGYSIYSALMYLYPYASGETLEEMNEFLENPDVEKFRQSQPIKEDNSQNNNNIDYFLGYEKPQFYTSGLFLVDDNFVLNTKDVSNFEFRDLHNHDIVSFVNDYVSQNTNNLIPRIIESPFEDSCKSVIIDTLYFKANWFDSFSKEDTSQDIFYGKDRETTIDYMNQTNNFMCYENLIRLNYADTPIVMDIVKDIDSVDSGFDYYLENCDKLSDNNNFCEVDLKLPKFTTENSIQLKDVLSKSGLENTFSSQADFSKLANDLHIDEIIQKTKIAVDENGTEAAAVTMMMVEDTAFMPPEEPIDFYVEKPFLYVLKDTETNEILFAGYFYNF